MGSHALNAGWKGNMRRSQSVDDVSHFKHQYITGYKVTTHGITAITFFLQEDNTFTVDTYTQGSSHHEPLYRMYSYLLHMLAASPYTLVTRPPQQPI